MEDKSQESFFFYLLELNFVLVNLALKQKATEGDIKVNYLKM